MATLLVVFIIAACVLTGSLLVARFVARSGKELRRSRRAVRAHEQFQRNLHTLALAHAQVDPFAQVVLDELATHTNKLHEIEEA